jgi:hypothetical protein
MQRASSLPLLLLTLLVGCAAPAAQAPAVKVLASEAPRARAELEADGNLVGASTASTKARIGAPGGSGAGSRRVAPARAKARPQSGNETVGGLPAGMGGLPAGTAGVAGPFG